jgi:hypothetical protein
MDKLTSSTVFPGEQFVVEGDVGLHTGNNTSPKKPLPQSRKNIVIISMDKESIGFFGIDIIGHYFAWTRL